jgi:hypothetical protein
MLTDEQKINFEANGFLVVRQALAQQELAGVQAAADKAAADKAAADRAAAEKAAADKAAADKAAADKAEADRRAEEARKAEEARQAEAARIAAEEKALAIRPFVAGYFGKQQRQYDESNEYRCDAPCHSSPPESRTKILTAHANAAIRS